MLWRAPESGNGISTNAGLVNMKLGRYPKLRITRNKEAIESRLLHVARHYRGRKRGARLKSQETLRSVARRLGVGKSTVHRYWQAIQSWQRLASLADPVEAHRARLTHVLISTWGKVDRKLERRLARVLIKRHQAITS